MVSATQRLSILKLRPENRPVTRERAPGLLRIRTFAPKGYEKGKDRKWYIFPKAGQVEEHPAEERSSSAANGEPEVVEPHVEPRRLPVRQGQGQALLVGAREQHPERQQGDERQERSRPRHEGNAEEGQPHDSRPRSQIGRAHV